MSTATASLAGNAWLVAREPIHIGGADSENRGNNNPIFRLPDRTPVLPGSSLRGALREHAEADPTYKGDVQNWFGGNPTESAPGRISLGWGWPVWWPVHVLGYAVLGSALIYGSEKKQPKTAIYCRKVSRVA